MALITDRVMLVLGRKKHDSVCGMYIRPAEAAATAEYGGRTIYFCSSGCKEQFGANPAQYA